MTRLKSRWLLPAGHALIDALLLVMLFREGHREQARERERHLGVKIERVWLQEGGDIAFDVTTAPPPGNVLLILSGNLPAGLAVDLLLPGPTWGSYRKPWRSMPLLLYQLLSALCWFGIGIRAEGHRSLSRVMLAYLGVRAAIALGGFDETGWRMQVICWMGFLLWMTAVGLRRMVRRVGAGSMG